MQRCAGRRCGRLGYRQARSPEGRRDREVRIERRACSPFAIATQRSFVRLAPAAGGFSGFHNGTAAGLNCARLRRRRNFARQYFGAAFVQPPRAGDVMSRGNSGIEKEGARRAAELASHRRPERHTMRHAADGKRLDQRIAVGVGPYLACVAAARFFIRFSSLKPMDIDTMADDVFGIGGFHDLIARCRARRYFRPRPAMPGCRAHAIAELACADGDCSVNIASNACWTDRAQP